jgi:ubiquinone/menaquinone biosynthesis C-methylase UbiE
MVLSKEENKQFWNNRAEAKGAEEFATSNERYLRNLEVRKLTEYIKIVNPSVTYDIGCGNGFSTFIYAREFPDKKFIGLDYAQNMIETAQKKLEAAPTANLRFDLDDITSLKIADNSADLVITSRVLINLQNFDNQIKAVKECARILKKEGSLLLLESVNQSYDNLNKYRKKYGLTELKAHEANFYIDEDKFLNKISNIFEVKKIDCFSSSYYLGTRVAFPLIIGAGYTPDANHIANQFFAEIAPSEDCGREKIYLLTKK